MSDRSGSNLAFSPVLTPRVSVMMPVYNAGKYLAESIESILAQDFTDFELVIIDDGSTDDSLKTIEAFVRKDPRVRYRSRPNTKIVGALNDGLDMCRAPLVARMDADDISLPTRLRKQVEHMDANRDCVAVGSKILLVDTEGWPICEMCQERTHEEIEETNLRAGGSAMNHPAVMFRADAVRKVGGYRQEMIYAEDLDLWLRLAEVGDLYNLPEVLVHYRMHANSISHARAEEQHHQWRAAVVDALKRREEEDDTAATKAVEPEKESSAADHHTRWAWWALMAGNVRTARKHAMACLRRRPFSIESWRLMFCCVRGR